MPRQFRILYKRTGSAAFSVLEPVAHRTLYERDQVKDAIWYLRDRPAAVGVAVRLGDELFNVIRFQQEALAPRAFTFEDSVAIGDDKPETD